MSGFNLFVYGTLRRGGSAHQTLDACEFVADGTVGGTLYDIDDSFPALLLYGAVPVYGEVWRCPAELLLRLDEYEGTARGLFRRVGVEVATDDGTLPCWTYAAGPALARGLLPRRRLASGRWPDSG
ncbi:gamma-glutamylcyclotransferase [soil metagenome]